jgi:hypothetical protein
MEDDTAPQIQGEADDAEMLATITRIIQEEPDPNVAATRILLLYVEGPGGGGVSDR